MHVIFGREIAYLQMWHANWESNAAKAQRSKIKDFIWKLNGQSKSVEEMLMYNFKGR